MLIHIAKNNSIHFSRILRKCKANAWRNMEAKKYQHILNCITILMILANEKKLMTIIKYPFYIYHYSSSIICIYQWRSYGGLCPPSAPPTEILRFFLYSSIVHRINMGNNNKITFSDILFNYSLTKIQFKMHQIA